ncbi:23S rRNA (uridine(2479)-2'-O)-methyltransferase [Candidatus Phycosocius bacilliformis]|uniref:23S rRNA (Uridine(2479)-2'-O)-methyltransferase n=1 Tax=Candidatus Phycosocius bacilliformis TaxID=1445552 RepID=A0A2P2E6X6_9PROT|nr:RNA methyltransferase [Candidatus Phycosocius bacilliformis]GBF56812.1 23S rRNA (uridine(2479)-2'-O)-methyltransferase [Candidatus Phycosocius bacilliformis]
MILDVTSPQNALVKLAKSLDRKKARTETGLFLAEGARHVGEGLALGWHLDALLFSAAAETRPAVQALANQALSIGARVARVSDRVLEAVAKRDNAQSVIGLFRQRLTNLEDLAQASLIIALERIRDPGNLGTILRTLDSVGGGGVVLLEESCDPFSVEAVRASMGSIFSAPVAKAGFDAFDAWRKAHGFTMAGTSLKGSTRHTDTDFGARTVLLMGNEQSGIPDNWAEACDVLVRLPMAGRADSLNLAIATAVTTYEIWRQKGFKGARD